MIAMYKTMKYNLCLEILKLSADRTLGKNVPRQLPHSVCQGLGFVCFEKKKEKGLFV